MIIYKIVGLKGKDHGERIYKHFLNAVNEKSKVELNIENKQIKLDDTIDSHIISLISSFEQVSFIDLEKTEEKNDKKKSDSHNHKKTEENQSEKNMFFVFLLNLFFSVAEFIFGTIFMSQAILSDAVHDLGDALSIGLAFFFEKISKRKSSVEYSYGYRRFSLLGGFVTSIILIVGALVMIVSTIPELFNPGPVNQTGVFWLAIAAIVINTFSVKLMSGGKSSNEKLLNIHLFEDLFGWILVLFMSIILRFTDWYILDPILSLGIAGWILYVTFPEFLRVSKIFLQATPDEIDTENIYQNIMALESVQAISHFHIWSIDGQEHMMSLIVTSSSESNRKQEKIKEAIRKIVLRHEITHLTIEVLFDPEKII